MGCGTHIVGPEIREDTEKTHAAPQEAGGRAQDHGHHREEVHPQHTDDWTTVDPDRVDAVADEITTLSAHIHAATHRLLEKSFKLAKL